MKGTKYSRLLFQLVPKTLRTEEIGAGLLLPTPTAMIDEAPIEKVDARNQKQMEKGNSPFILGLGQQAMRGMLPTPRTADAEGGCVNNVQMENGNYFRTNKEGVRWGVKLRDVVESGMLPTPTAMDSTNATATMKSTQVKEGSMHSVTLNRYILNNPLLNTPCASDKNGGCTRSNPKLQLGSSLVNEMHGVLNRPAGKTSQLNPRFVAEMMGFPPNWTELPFQNGEQNQSKDMGTP